MTSPRHVIDALASVDIALDKARLRSRIERRRRAGLRWNQKSSLLIVLLLPVAPVPGPDEVAWPTALASRLSRAPRSVRTFQKSCERQWRDPDRQGPRQDRRRPHGKPRPDGYYDRAPAYSSPGLPARRGPSVRTHIPHRLHSCRSGRVRGASIPKSLTLILRLSPSPALAAPSISPACAAAFQARSAASRKRRMRNSPSPELREAGAARKLERMQSATAGWAGYLAILAPELAPNSTGQYGRPRYHPYTVRQGNRGNPGSVVLDGIQRHAHFRFSKPPPSASRPRLHSGNSNSWSLPGWQQTVNCNRQAKAPLPNAEHRPVDGK